MNARIALILPRFSRYGGVEQFAWQLAEALADQYEVDVLCARTEALPPEGVHVHVLGRPFGFSFIKQLWFLYRSEHMRRLGCYDVVMGFGQAWKQDLLRVGGGPQRAFWQLSEQAWPQGWPRLWKQTKRLLNPSSWVTRWLDNRQYQSGCRIVCVSDAVRDWTLQTYPHIPTPEVIYNQPNIQRFSLPTDAERSKARSAFNVAPSDVLLLTATTNFMLKATGALIRALALLPHNFSLAVAGGRAPQAYQRLAQNLGVESRVRFLGKIDNMPTLYHAADLFALPSFYDACSNAVLEARACGLKVLSSSTNGSSRFLPERWITSTPGDPHDLARRLLAMYAEPAPPPFVMPNNISAGIGAWVTLIESMLIERARH